MIISYLYMVFYKHKKVMFFNHSLARIKCKYKMYGKYLKKILKKVKIIWIIKKNRHIFAPDIM